MSLDFILENLLLPLLVNVFSPVLLFLFGNWFLKNNFVAKQVSRIYRTVKDRLELDAEEIPDVNEADSTHQHIETISAAQNDDSKILSKLSKNYGADTEKGWDVRTFYTFTKQQLFNNEYINFKERDNKFDITLKTQVLIDKFKVNSENEQVSDGAGKIRVYIFQRTNSKNKKENYLVRFGRKTLEEPVKLDSLQG
ncbi:hypothetical protein ACMZ6Y_09195 [Streptococcus pluranimalium]|uniref:hypothetical protein n=1 Tax=Streptococcus hyovaginalis TaxID=149015 RepID=UPI003AD23DC8